MKKLYGELKMSWLRVILFALISGVYTGLVMLITPLKNTSFQDIGISYEWWVIFAVIIVVNCEKSWDAMLKCFVFFLISQPLVYAVQVAAGALSVDLALNYYLRIWLPATFLTLPGGFIAFYCKKQNLLGAIILGIGNFIQMILCAAYVVMAIEDFPHHILSALVCLASAVIMWIYIQREKKYRLISILVTVVLSIAVIVVVKFVMGRVLISNLF